MTFFPETNCGNCPEAVMSELRKIVRKAFSDLRSIRDYTNIFAAVEASASADAVKDVSTVVDAIPEPIVLDFSDIADYLLCPLLPLALGLGITDFQALDPRTQLDKIRAFYIEYAGEVRENYENALRTLGSWQTIRVFKTYIDAIKRFRFTAEAQAKATLICTNVAVTCPTAYRGSVFEDYIKLISEFSIDGIVPDSLTGAAGTIAAKLAEGERKIAQWGIVAAGGTL